MATFNGTITSGGNAQAFSSLADDVLGFIFFAFEEDAWVRIGGTAAVGAGILVPSGQSCGFIRRRSESISVFGATTGSKFAFMEVV